MPSRMLHRTRRNAHDVRRGDVIGVENTDGVDGELGAGVLRVTDTARFIRLHDGRARGA